MKLAIITAEFPFGSAEAFLSDELRYLFSDDRLEIYLIPRSPKNNIFHNVPRYIIDHSLYYRSFSLIYLKATIKMLFNIETLKIIIGLISKSRNIKIALKNLYVIPKSLFLVDWAKKEKIQHVHAHWGSTTATIAYIISRLCAIPYSMTLHRWDIKENNILEEKIKSASFIRCISESGLKMIEKYIDLQLQKYQISIIHMGVYVPNIEVVNRIKKDRITILCPANLIEVKGHIYLIEACKILSEKGIEYKCIIAGKGPLENKLKQIVVNLKLDNNISFVGMLPREKILNMYRDGEIDLVVLPSIVTDSGDHEGIPVSLIEAMSYGIPVIGTATGGIPELLRDRAGVIVPQRDSVKIAHEISNFIYNRALVEQIGSRGKDRIIKDYNIKHTASKLTRMIINSNYNEN